jgi:hypothetical protein
VRLDPLLDRLLVLARFLAVLLKCLLDLVILRELDRALELLERLLFQRVGVLEVADQMLVT